MSTDTDKLSAIEACCKTCFYWGWAHRPPLQDGKKNCRNMRSPEYRKRLYGANSACSVFTPTRAQGESS